jgi:hypothetical protein
MTGRRRALLLALLAVLASAGTAASQGRMPARSRVGAAALEAARQFLCPHGGMPVPGRRGRCRGGGATGMLGDDPSVRGWDSGLPPAARRQSACPEGTTPAPALARTDATRCVPR